MNRWIVIGALLALIAVPVAAAQPTQTPPPAASTPAVASVQLDNGYSYDVARDQPVTAYVESTWATKEAAGVSYIVLAQLPDGTVTQLTPCDNRTVVCATIPAAAIGPFADAAVGDAHQLSTEVANAAPSGRDDAGR